MDHSEDGPDSVDAVNLLEDLDFFLKGDSNENPPSGIEEHEICKSCTASGTNPLRATTLGHVKCLEGLLSSEEGVSIEGHRTEHGANALHVAAKQGNEATLQALIRHDKTCLQSKDGRGATPAHVAAYNGNYECMKKILEAGGLANAKADDGATPLHFAAARGKLDCVQCLASWKEVNVNEKTKSGATAVYFAAQEGHLDVLQWLVAERSADAKAPSSDGMTPLHAACQTGQLNCTHWLVRSAGCSVLCRTDDGATPIHFAATKGHVAILQWMLHQRLADGSERDDFGATPVHDAAEQNQLNSLEVFAAHSTDMHPKDNDGLTPKDLAEEGESIACSSFLQKISKGVRRGQSVRRPAEATPQLLTSFNQHLPSIGYKEPEIEPPEKKETKWRLFHKKKSSLSADSTTRGKIRAFFTISRGKKLTEESAEFN
eukprot:m.156743 g.156743  ORF g.156743 m.156743 type:complete len:431 (+) comp38691_c2_seq4:2044-3336(+)